MNIHALKKINLNKYEHNNEGARKKGNELDIDGRYDTISLEDIN